MRSLASVLQDASVQESSARRRAIVGPYGAARPAPDRYTNLVQSCRARARLKREQGPVYYCMVNLEPRRPHPVTGHTHTELYVVCGICGLCLLFLALAFVDTRKRMSVRKRLLGEKLA